MLQIKNILAAVICVSMVALLTVCAKELNQAPQSTANNSAIFGSTQCLALYSASFYDGLTTAANEVRGDDQYGDADYGARNSIPLYLQDSTFTSQQASHSSDWNWKPLRNINYFIENVSIPNPAISTTVQQNYLGLARFFRAYFYYNMV